MDSSGRPSTASPPPITASGTFPQLPPPGKIVATAPAQGDQLLALSATPPRPLFPLIRRATALQPLLIPLLALPLLFAESQRNLTPQAAVWGLQILSGLAPNPSDAWRDPASRPNPPFPFHPPLQDWLARLPLSLFPPSQDAGWLLLGSLSTCFLLLSICLLARNLGGGRLALLAGLLLASDPCLLQLSQSNSPAALGVAWAVLALWGAAAHLRKGQRIVSWQLLGAGIALGACALTRGPLCLAVLVILVLNQIISTTNQCLYDQQRPELFWSRCSNPWISLFVLCLTAFAVAGWWFMMMYSRYGSEFAINWLDPTAVAESWLQSAYQPRFWPVSIRTLNGLGSAWLPLAAVGLASLRHGSDPQRFAHAGRGLMITWAIVATICWLWHLSEDGLNSLGQESWLTLARVPYLLLASIGALELLERRVAPWMTSIILSTILGLQIVDLSLLGYLEPQLPPTVSIGWTALTCGLLGALAVAIAERWAADRELLRRWVWSTVCLLALGISFVVTARALEARSPDEGEWRSLRAQLLKLGPRDECLLVMTSRQAGRTPEPPAELRFILQAVWPRVRIARTDSWTTAASVLTGPSRSGSHFRLPASPDEEQQAPVIIACGRKGLGQMPGTGLVVKPAGESTFPGGWEIVAFTVVSHREL